MSGIVQMKEKPFAEVCRAHIARIRFVSNGLIICCSLAAMHFTHVYPYADTEFHHHNDKMHKFREESEVHALFGCRRAEPRIKEMYVKWRTFVTSTKSTAIRTNSQC